LNILDYLTYDLDIGYSVDVIYLDFRKAFDLVLHQRLLHKLIGFGIHGKLLKWIESFLTHRQQQVVLNGHLSYSSPVINGVPQGSILRPLLFIMYINDLPSIVSSLIYMFADDTNIFCIIRDVDDYLTLQNDLDSLYRWSILR